MQNKRLIGFLCAILVGLLAGLAYGWLINPPGAQRTTLSSLRSDYQTDYVLMVAEKFSVDRDVSEALALLEKIAPKEPAASVKQAMILGQQLGYSEREQQFLADLESALASSAEVAP